MAVHLTGRSGVHNGVRSEPSARARGFIAWACIVEDARNLREQHLARSVQSLSAQERIDYYRAMSAEALRQAQATDHLEHRANSLDNAARWLALANEVESVRDHLGEPHRETH
jgi:hypothetical protein